MSVVIVMRSRPNYLTLTKESFARQLNDPHKPHSEIRTMIEHNVLDLWDDCFLMNYFHYRDQVARIAELCLQKTGCIVKGPEEFAQWYRQGDPNDLIVPVDDDDWFCPDLSRVADMFQDETNLLCWKKSTYKSYNSTKFYHKTGLVLGSNNWAVRNRWLQILDHETAKHFVLGSHRHAETKAKDLLSNSQIMIQDHSWSLYVRHLGSMAMLRAFAREGNLKETLKAAAKRWPKRCDLPKQFAWAEPWIEASYDLSCQMRRRMMC